MEFSSLTRVRPLGFHPVTWLMGLVVSGALVLIMVPGEMVELGYSHDPTAWDKQKGAVYRSVSQKYPYSYDSATRVSTDVHVMIYEHGWPLPCYVRGIGLPLTRTHSSGWCATGSMGAPMPPPTIPHHWSEKANWPLSSDAAAVDPMNYTINLGVAMLLAALSVGGTERWLRKRGGLFRLRIIDLLGTIAIVGGVMGLWAWHGHVGHREGLVVQQMSESRSPRHADFATTYVGPDWLRRLCGNAESLPRLSHVTSVRLTIGPSWRDDLEQVAELPYVEELSLEGAISAELLESLNRFSRLKSLTLRVAAAASSEMSAMEVEKEDLIVSHDLLKLSRLSLDVIHLHGLVVEIDDLERLLEGMEPGELLLAKSHLRADDIRGIRKRHPSVHVMISD